MSKILTAYLSFCISVVACRLNKSNFRSDGFRLCLGKEVGVWKKDTKMTQLFHIRQKKITQYQTQINNVETGLSVVSCGTW